MRLTKNYNEILRLEMRLNGFHFQQETVLFPLQVAFHPEPTLRPHSAADRLLLLIRPMKHQILLVRFFLQNLYSILTCCLVVE